MTIQYTCESCDSTLNIKDEKAGQKGKCPKCGESFTVPSPSSKKKKSSKKRKAEKAVQEAEEKKKKADRDAFFDEFIAQDDAKPSYEESEEAGLVRPKTRNALSKTSGSAAGTAGDLLSLTGKKARDDDDDWDGVSAKPDEGGGLTVGEVAEGVGRQLVLPIAGVTAAIVVVFILSQIMFAPNRDLPDLAYVSGKVTLDGKPLKRATVKFVLKDAWGPNSKVKVSAAYGRTNDEGEYTIKYATDVEGAVIGLNRVEISAKIPKGSPYAGVEFIPKWYNHSTQLEWDVKPGRNSDADFKLSSSPINPRGPTDDAPNEAMP